MWWAGRSWKATRATAGDAGAAAGCEREWYDFLATGTHGCGDRTWVGRRLKTCGQQDASVHGVAVGTAPGGEVAPPMLLDPPAAGASSPEEVRHDPSRTTMRRESLRSKGGRKVSMARLAVWRGDILHRLGPQRTFAATGPRSGGRVRGARLLEAPEVKAAEVMDLKMESDGPGLGEFGGFWESACVACMVINDTLYSLFHRSPTGFRRGLSCFKSQ